MSFTPFNSSISQLAGNSTFYDWYLKENNEIIAKLNDITVSGVTSGDGVLASLNATTGIVTVSIGGTSGNIQSGLTFSGPISFNGEVVIPNSSFKVSGITTGTSGYTFGSVVRINSSGYTAAKANDPDSAEVVGVISSQTSSYSVVTVLGRINGNFQTVAGGTLSPGCVYFLSGTTAGYITTTEPTTIGYVSKPVILGLGETAGVVLQYRGNYLNDSGAEGLSGTNKVYVQISKSITNPSSYGFSAGNFISFAPDILAGNTFFHQWLENTGRTAIDGWFLSGSQNYANNLDGVISTPSSSITVFDFTPEEDFIVGMIESVDESSSGSYNIYKLITHGSTTVIPRSIQSAATKQGIWVISGLTYTVPASGVTGQLRLQDTYRYSSDGGFMVVGQVFDSSPTNWHVSIRPTSDSYLGAVSYRSAASSTLLTNGMNYAFNGDLSIWQRSTGRDSQYTTSGDVYFADNWIRRQSGIASGSSQYIQRQTFSTSSTEVEGTPEYYINVKCIADPGGADPTGGEYSVGHVIEEIETFNGGDLTVSLYAKASMANYSANVYFARYSGGSQVSKETIGTIDLTTSWAKYSFTYEVPTLAAGSYTNDYVEIGVDLIPLVEEAYDNTVAVGTGLYVSLASMVVYAGAYTSPPHIFESYEDKLRKSRKFYYTSYLDTQTSGSSTMLSSTEPALNTLSFTYLPTAPFHLLKLPTTMRTDPTVTIYSPKGVANEIFNYTAGRDLKSTSGTIGYASALRNGGTPGSATISTSQDKTTVRINISKGAVPYDVVNYHIIADASYPI
jgi:hypothetical protein